MPHATIFRLLLIVFGIFFLIVPFIPGLRSEKRPSNNIISFLVGLLGECQVALSYYADALRIAHDPAYWKMVQLQSGVGGIGIGLLAAMAIRHVYAHRSKNPNA